MIKLIVFDLWSTLVPATIDFVRLASIARHEHKSLSEFIQRYELATQLKKYNNFDELKKDFFDAFNWESKELLERELDEVYNNRFDKIRFFPEVEKNLMELRKKGYKLALLSNTESIGIKLVEDKLRLKNFFDLLEYSFEVGAVKPNPVMFNSVLKKMNVSPEESLMVGDSLRRDVVGAQNIGMHGCLLNRKNEIFDSSLGVKPEFEIKSLSELRRVLGVLNAESKD
jgi:putative hydrolase of the HAD superfamily